jgi:replicative DNA helicase
MFDGDYAKVFEVLKGTQERIDISKLRELTGVPASLVADLSVLSTEVEFGDLAVINKDVEEFIATKYKELIKEKLEANEMGAIQSVINEIQEKEPKDIISRYEEYEQENAEASKSGLLGFSTGIDKLDRITLGMAKRHIWVCGAYYGYGKTYFMLNLIENAVVKGKKVLLFSLEMTAEEILGRLIGLSAGLGTIEMFRELDEEKNERRMEAKEFWLQAVVDGRLVIEDEMRDVNGVVARIGSGGGFDLVCLDYIQLLSTGGDQYEALREAMKVLQMVTKRYGFTLLLLSQISNQAQKEGYQSRVDGFKGAGDIGQIANVAMRVEREKNEETGEYTGFFGLNISKVRHNMPGKIALEIEFPGGRIR